MNNITIDKEKKYSNIIITLGEPIEIFWLWENNNIEEALNMLYHDLKERNYTGYYLTVEQYKNLPLSDDKQEYYLFINGDETIDPGYLIMTHIKINRNCEILDHKKINIFN